MDNIELKTLLLECNKHVDTIIQEIKIIKSLKWNESDIEKFCTERQIVFNNAYLTQLDTQQQIDNIKSFTFDKIEKNLVDYKTKNNSLLSNLFNWNNYNQQYKTYFENKAVNFAALSKRFVNSTQKIVLPTYLNSILNGLTLIDNNIRSDIDELYENFKYGNKNYVIFGKNGAGKTTLLNKIATNILNQNSFVIPANRSLSIQPPNTALYYQPDLQFNDIFKNPCALQYLTMHISSRTLNDIYYNKHTSNNLIKELETIFNSLDLERKIFIENNYIYLYVNDKNDKYPLTDSSDGEKAVLYILLAILQLPSNAFVFIDEPELHLNGALMQKLYNSLENIRPDIKFIYVTHMINFVESRKNVELIYLKKRNKKNMWEFRTIENFESTDIDMILSIEGTQDDIIFCEGDNQKSIDHQILDCIYDDCFIKPVGSCELVINNTKLLQNTGKYSFLRRRAFAVIDNDFRISQEIESLEESKIKVLNYNEWENLLLCEDVITYVNAHTSNLDLSEIKSNIINLIHKRKEVTMSDFLNKKYKKILDVNKITYKNLESQITTLNEQNKQTLLDSLHEYEARYEDYIASNNYEELIKIVPAKCIFKESAKYLGFSDSEAYINRIVVLIKQDPTFKTLLKNKVGLNRS